jgi:hypothetical protein
VTVPKDDPSSVSAAMAVLSSSSSTDEWYVGINGVPVGPVRLSELRRKAASGLITEESLVWREGFEEWLPLRTFPELVAMLKETGTNRASLTPAPPQAAPMPSNRPQAPPTGKAAASLPGPRPAPAPRGTLSPARNNVVALASRRATAEKIEGLGEPVRDDEIRFEAETAAPPATASALLSPPPSPSVPAPAGHTTHSGLGTRFAESRRAHPAAWLVVGLGGMFLGVAAMVFLLPKGSSKPAVQIVSVMVPTPPPPAATGEGEGMTSIGPIEVSAPTSTKPAGGSKGAKAADPGGGGTPSPLSTGLTGLTGLVGGPSGASGPIAKSGGSGPLQTADLERAVQSHRAFVKRQCWDVALASRAPGAPSSVRVVATITVAPDGHVQSVNAQGGEAYPGLATCVQGQVKNWTFPPSDGGTFSVPFIFAAQ